MPSANEKIADHLANRRVRSLIACSRDSQARSAYAAFGYADREGDGGVQVQQGPDPRQRGDQAKPGLCAMPTHPDHTSATAGAARTSSGQDRMAWPGRATAGDRSTGASAVVRAGTGPRRPRSVAGEAPAVSAAIPVT